MMKSNATANKAAGIAPSKIRQILFNDKSWVIKSPKPPAPINAAMVVIPMVIAVVVGIPPYDETGRRTSDNSTKGRGAARE